MQAQASMKGPIYVQPQVIVSVCFVSRRTSRLTHLSPHTSHRTPYTSHLTPHTSHVTQWILDSIVARKRLGEVNVQCKLHAANIKACAAKYEQQTTNSNPKPQTPNPKPQTPNPKPQTPNPKPQTPNPKQAAYTVVNRGQSLVGRL